jgi:hypothetical protein
MTGIGYLLFANRCLLSHQRTVASYRLSRRTAANYLRVCRPFIGHSSRDAITVNSMRQFFNPSGWPAAARVRTSMSEKIRKIQH